jgi:hypothetical protein
MVRTEDKDGLVIVGIRTEDGVVNIKMCDPKKGGEPEYYHAHLSEPEHRKILEKVFSKEDLATLIGD